MRLVGLDFETANGCCGSICSVGVAVVENGLVADSREWLVRPHKGYGYMRPDFTEIHGITWWDIKDAPELCDIWQDVRHYLLSADNVVIHNATFDLRHLSAVLALYELPPIAFPYVDSLQISRQLYPGMRHNLNVMAAYFNFPFQHHNSREDAAACAYIAAKMGIPKGAEKQFTYPTIEAGQ